MPSSTSTIQTAAIQPRTTQNAADLTALLKVLGDPTRLRILGLLEIEELSVGELSRSLGMAQSRVSNHLRVLRE
ncbi:MAG: metalloregulator ArsR/SmtB family transcription factor, partial [Planctomycetota bacterium]